MAAKQGVVTRATNPDSKYRVTYIKYRKLSPDNPDKWTYGTKVVITRKYV